MCERVCPVVSLLGQNELHDPIGKLAGCVLSVPTDARGDVFFVYFNYCAAKGLDGYTVRSIAPNEG